MEQLRAIMLVLEVLRAARQKIAGEFLSEDHILFLDILRSRKGGEAANILLERNFLSWHLSHFEILDELVASQGLDERETQELIGLVASLVREFTEGSGARNSALFTKLLSERLSVLDGLVQANERSERNLNRLKYLSEKESAGIERLMESLSKSVQMP